MKRRGLSKRQSKQRRENDGFPGRVDRLKQLGNAVVPQIPYLIGKAIMELENETKSLSE